MTAAEEEGFLLLPLLQGMDVRLLLLISEGKLLVVLKGDDFIFLFSIH